VRAAEPPAHTPPPLIVMQQNDGVAILENVE